MYRDSNFNKILEKLVYKRLLKFLEWKSVLFDKQCGFRQDHSTQYAMLSIIDKIQSAIDNRSTSCGIFLDVSEAFDTVNHDILVKKLEYYGVRGIVKDWFVSYLNDRRQVVSINNVTSCECTVACGVPQGSILGPLLFLIYICKKPDMSFLTFKACLYNYYYSATLTVFDQDNMQTWKSVCVKCHKAGQLAGRKKCCF